jgi:PelA/Pel-15E family pectate lyase
MASAHRQLRIPYAIKFILNIAPCILFQGLNAQELQADNMLLFQRVSGGWSKQYHGKAFSYNVQFSDIDKADIANEAKKADANIDNESTKKEIRYLASAYKKFNNPKYLSAVENGIRYLLKAQYENGGWPQYYPDKSLYRAQITYNDNAMINVLNVLQDVALKQNDLEIVSPVLIEPCAAAVKKGIECILKTQIQVNGKPTAWCQQYDQVTLQPAKARAYELPSISSAESYKIVEFLMNQPQPSKDIKNAIHAAVEWFEKVRIRGYKFVTVPAPGTAKGTGKKLETDSTSVLWARYYEIESNKPFFSDREGIVKYSINDIDYERRNGYAWYGVWPRQLLEEDFPAWVKKNEK